MQSALSPAGHEAETIADLLWILVAAAVVLWVLLNGLFFYVTRIHPRPLSRRLAQALIIGGGLVFPTVALALLLTFTLPMMPELRAQGDGLTIRVRGEQWWWRVEYRPARGGAPVVAANEVRLPVGMRTEFLLDADQVIHSFWIPSLAGKMDMFPGRQTRLVIEPTRTGTFRGQCAEFCGTSHALMAFTAVVMEPEAFEAWLAAEAGPAAEPVDRLARRGRGIFMAQGCGACHTIRGTPATGDVGPDLTHFGNRHSLGAGILPPTAEALTRWIAHTEAVKPKVSMPAYDGLDPAELEALAHYLVGLE